MLRLHDLRHAHGQWPVNAGVPEAAVQASLSHTNGAMTARYTAQLDGGHQAVKDCGGWSLIFDSVATG